MNRIAELRIAAGLAIAVAISGCAVFDPLPTPGTRSKHGVQAPLCPEYASALDGGAGSGTGDGRDGEFVGGAAAAVHCIDAWRAAYYDALKDHARFRAGQELLIGALSAKALYDGITEAGNGHHIAALGTGAALLYGNMVRRSPNPKLEVYAAGLQALSCAAIQSRPLLMTNREHERLSAVIELQAAQLGALSGALAFAAQDGTSTAADIDARNALNLMQADLDRAATMRDRLATSGSEIRAQTLRIVANVTDALRSTEPDPASITNLIASYKALAGSFAHGFLPAVSSGAGEVAVPRAQRDGGSAEGGGGGRADDGPSVSCAKTWALTEAGVAPEAGDPRKVSEALYCAHRGAYELRIRMASVAAIERVTASIEGCGKPEDLQPAKTISLQPDVNRIDLKIGGSYTLGVRSAGGIPAVQLYGNSAGALEELDIESSLGYLVVQIKATQAVTPSPVVLAVIAPNGDTRQVEIVVNDPQPTPTGGGDAGDSGSTRATLGLRPGEEALAIGDRIRTLQCMLGLAPSAQARKVGPRTRDRLRIANEALGLGKHGDSWSEELESALEGLARPLNCRTGPVSEADLAEALRKAR